MKLLLSIIIALLAANPVLAKTVGSLEANGGAYINFTEAEELGIPGGELSEITASPSSGAVFYATDGASPDDCDTGGGSEKVFCIYDGSSWVYSGGFNSNAIVENDFQNSEPRIWQRYPGSAVTIGSASEQFVADRIGEYRSSGSSLVVDQGAFAPGQTVVPGNPKYYHESVVVTDSAATEENYSFIRMLDVGRYSGETVAIKIHGSADAAKDIAVEITQNFGTGGSPDVPVGVETVSLTTSFEKNILFVSIPSISGKTVGTLSYTEFKVWRSAGTNFNTNTNSLGNQSGTFNLSKIEIYQSDKELPVRRKTREESLFLCLDYCRKSYERDTPPGTATDVGCLKYRHQDTSSRTGIFDGGYPLEKPMMKPPSVTFYSTDSGAAGYAYNNGTLSDVGATPQDITTKLLWSRFSLVTAVANAEIIEYQFLASAEL